MTALQDHEAADKPSEQAQEANPLLREADFSFPAAPIDEKVNVALMRQKDKVAIKGFRRGKVPLSMLRQHFGRKTLHEVLQEECIAKFQETLKEKQERAAAYPHLQMPEVAVEENYHVHCYYEVIPAIAPADFSEKKLQKPTFTVDEKAVDEMVEILRTQRGEYVQTDDAAQEENDRLRVDFSSTLVTESGENGEVLETGEDRPLPLNDKGLHPKLREALTGARSGDTREVELTVPDGAQDEALRGRPFKMHITVRAVERLNKAVLDETFFAAFTSEEKTLESFRKAVKEHLERESKVRVRSLLQSRALELLLNATPPFALPTSMVQREAYGMLQRAQAQWKERRMAETAAQLSPELFVPQAQKRVALGLVLSAWQQRESPVIDKEAIEARLQELTAAYEDPAAAAAQLRNSQSDMEAVYLSVLEDRVTDWVCEHCETEEVAMTLEDFLNTNAAQH